MQDFLLTNPTPSAPPHNAVLTFERLVSESAARLAEQGIDADHVRDILQDAGIDEALRAVAPEPQGRLVVHQVQIHGEKPERGSFIYRRQLGSGLWSWIGANGTGKTTILNCIVWALTGSDGGITRRARRWINDILVWFSLGEQKYTSRVARRAEAVSGGIYQGFQSLDQIDLGGASPEISYDSRDEMREVLDRWFMTQLGITSLRWTAHSAQKDDPDLHAHATTWRTYAHAIHIEDDSYDDLLIDPSKAFGRQDRKILEMMLGVEYARAVAEIQVQADFAREAFGRARSRVGGKRTTLTEQITALEQQLADVNQALSMLETSPTPVENDTPLIEARTKRADLLAEQNRLSVQLAELETQQSALMTEIMDAEREKVAIQEQSEVEYLINSLAVVRCPHCESAVDDPTRLTKEKVDHTCHVCAQPIQRTRSSGDLKMVLRERDEAIAALRKSLKQIIADADDLREQLDASRAETAKLGRVLEQSVTQARQGFTATYSNMLMQKGQLEGQIAQLRRSLSEIDDEQREVETAARWHAVLQTASEVADRLVFSMSEHLFEELSQLAARLASEFGLPDLERVIIDEKRYVKLVQGGLTLSHNEMARSERVKFKIAFHLALMLIQVREGLGKHPGFLIVDTPGTAEINPEDLVAIVRDLARIQSLYGDKIQILMATARTEAADYLPPSTVEVPQAEGKFF